MGVWTGLYEAATHGSTHRTCSPPPPAWWWAGPHRTALAWTTHATQRTLTWQSQTL